VSLVLPPRAWQSDCGRRAVARLLPYPSVLPGLPWQYESEVDVRDSPWLSSLWNSRELSLRVHRPRASFAFPHTVDSSNALTIKDPSDVGSLFRASNIKTRMPTITAGHSLFPTSYACTAVRLPRGRLTLRNRTGFPRSTSMTNGGLGLSFTPVTRRPRYPICEGVFLATYRFGRSLSASLAPQNLRCLQRFACADHTTVPSAATAIRLADLVITSRFSPRNTSATLSPALCTKASLLSHSRVGNR
jgi:hypothetical protein